MSIWARHCQVDCRIFVVCLQRKCIKQRNLMSEHLSTSAQFSPLTDWVVGGGHEERFSRDPLQVFSAGGPCEQFWHGQECPLFDDVHPASPLPTTASPTLQAALNGSFGEAVMVCDLPQPCKFLSLDSCQKRSKWTHKGVDLTPHQVVGLVLQVADVEKFPHAVRHLVLKHLSTEV